AIAATVVRPSGSPRAVLQCLPGGGCSRSYWTLAVDDDSTGSYDFAAYMAQRGYAVIAAHHLGTRDSSDPDQAGSHHESTMAAAMARCLAVLRRELGLQALPCVGVGHSFGAGMTIVQQDGHQDFSAVGLFGWSSTRLATVGADGVLQPIDEVRRAPEGRPP